MAQNSLQFQSSLKDIIKVRARKDSVFHQYKDKDEIGKVILNELNARLVDLGDGKLGIPMDDSEKKIGLLSQCQGLQTLVSLAKDFGLDFNTIFPEVKNQKGTIREIMDAILEDVVDRITVKTDETADEEHRERAARFIFDASPYDSSHFTTEISSIETITWVLPAIFQILKYHADQHEVCKWEDRLVRIVRYGLRYLNEAFIDGSNSTSKGLTKGWNFTKNCEEPSLYFSFVVGECYLDLYSTFEDVLKYAYAKRNYNLYGIPIDEELKEFHDKKALEFIEKKDAPVEKKSDARHDEYNEMVRLFRRINALDELEELRVDEDTRVGLLEKNCQAVALAIWDFVKKDLGDKFFYNDLATTLVEDDLRMSTTSDALFNTVYIVNAMIDGGLDELFQLKMRSAMEQGQEAEALHYQREYDNLLESCQLAVQRAFRTYDSLKNDGKDYIVDQFLIGFNERFDYHKRMVADLRKLRMKAFSLLPMLIHTNNIISEYLIQYPQANMRKYLEYILENRYAEDGQVHWIWEKDGYFSGSNYYYVNALNEFYTYYKTYEADYIRYGNDNKRAKEEAIAQLQKQLNGPDGQITLLKQDKKQAEETIAKKDAQIAQLEQALKEVPTPMEDAVRDLIDQELDRQFAARMAQTFVQASKALTLTQIDATEDPDGVYASVCKSMYEMLAANILADYYAGSKKIKSADDYEQKAAAFHGDVQATLRAYITSINNSIDSKTSKLRKFFDKD